VSRATLIALPTGGGLTRPVRPDGSRAAAWVPGRSHHPSLEGFECGGADQHVRRSDHVATCPSVTLNPFGSPSDWARSGHPATRNPHGRRRTALGRQSASCAFSVRAGDGSGRRERATGIEPALSAWELDCHASLTTAPAGQAATEVVREYPSCTIPDSPAGHAAGTPVGARLCAAVARAVGFQVHRKWTGRPESFVSDDSHYRRRG
jgi:hypothetical protein